MKKQMNQNENKLQSLIMISFFFKFNFKEDVTTCFTDTFYIKQIKTH